MANPGKHPLTLMLLLLTLIVTWMNVPVRSITMPLSQQMIVGDHLKIPCRLPQTLAKNFIIHVAADRRGLLKMPNGSTGENAVFSLQDTAPVAAKTGAMQVQLKLFGVLPLQQMVINVIPEVKVMPGGQSIGVLLQSEGVMVVGRSAIVDSKGNKHTPAADAGIKVGDTILKINGQKVETEIQVRDAIAQAGSTGQKISMEIKHQDKIFTTQVQPILCSETKRYRVGLYVRDSAAGVGTLSWYDPESKIYGALGHIITDIDTRQKINLADGKVVGATVQDIHPGKPGQPGEKIGLFQEKNEISGNINRNTACGIFGEMQKPVTNPYFSKPLPVALASQVKPGPAEIFTVIKGNQIEKYKILIEQVLDPDRPDGKGLVLKITDPGLLKKTGGIIQGMSGSPIIQNEKLVGAITHVFVNDPTRGYGVLAERMVIEAGITAKHVSDNNLEINSVNDSIACLFYQIK